MRCESAATSGRELGKRSEKAAFALDERGARDMEVRGSRSRCLCWSGGEDRHGRWTHVCADNRHEVMKWRDVKQSRVGQAERSPYSGRGAIEPAAVGAVDAKSEGVVPHQCHRPAICLDPKP